MLVPSRVSPASGVTPAPNVAPAPDVPRSAFADAHTALLSVCPYACSRYLIWRPAWLFNFEELGLGRFAEYRSREVMLQAKQTTLQVRGAHDALKR